jgi:Zn-dependent protease
MTSLVEADRNRATPPPSRGPVLATLVGVGALLAGKFKLVLGLLKFLKLGKFWLTSVSMVAMVWFEAQRNGWPFGVGFVLLILIHELGHGYAIKRAGLAAGWPVFIPFLGAQISLKGQIQSRAQEAEIAWGGPLWGAAAASGCAALYLVNHSPLFLALAYTGFFLNLFNLIPVRPLDGGRIAQAFSRRAWWLGLVALGAMFLWSHSPQLILIGVMAVSAALSKDTLAPLPAAEGRAWAARYFGLIAFLVVGAQLSQTLLHRAD